MRILGGEKKGVSLETRRGSGTRPLSARAKESLFAILEPELPGARFYDFFAGNGAVGLEALSRGAALARFYEKDGLCLRIIRENIRRCGFEERAEAHRRDVLKTVPRLDPEDAFAVVFLGPPYGRGLAHESLRLLGERSPFENGALVAAETRKNEALEKRYGPLTAFREKIYGDTRIRLYRSG